MARFRDLPRDSCPELGPRPDPRSLPHLSKPSRMAHGRSANYDHGIRFQFPAPHHTVQTGNRHVKSQGHELRSVSRQREPHPSSEDLAPMAHQVGTPRLCPCATPWTWRILRQGSHGSVAIQDVRTSQMCILPMWKTDPHD